MGSEIGTEDRRVVNSGEMFDLQVLAPVFFRELRRGLLRPHGYVVIAAGSLMALLEQSIVLVFLLIVMVGCAAFISYSTAQEERVRQHLDHLRSAPISLVGALIQMALAWTLIVLAWTTPWPIGFQTVNSTSMPGFGWVPLALAVTAAFWLSLHAAIAGLGGGGGCWTPILILITAGNVPGRSGLIPWLIRILRMANLPEWFAVPAFVLTTCGAHLLIWWLLAGRDLEPHFPRTTDEPGTPKTAFRLRLPRLPQTWTGPVPDSIHPRFWMEFHADLTFYLISGLGVLVYVMCVGISPWGPRQPLSHAHGGPGLILLSLLAAGIGGCRFVQDRILGLEDEMALLPIRPGRAVLARQAGMLAKILILGLPAMAFACGTNVMYGSASPLEWSAYMLATVPYVAAGLCLGYVGSRLTDSTRLAGAAGVLLILMSAFGLAWLRNSYWPLWLESVSDWVFPHVFAWGALGTFVMLQIHRDRAAT